MMATALNALFRPLATLLIRAVQVKTAMVQISRANPPGLGLPNSGVDEAIPAGQSGSQNHPFWLQVPMRPI